MQIWNINAYERHFRIWKLHFLKNHCIPPCIATVSTKDKIFKFFFRHNTTICFSPPAAADVAIYESFFCYCWCFPGCLCSILLAATLYRNLLLRLRMLVVVSAVASSASANAVLSVLRLPRYRCRYFYLIVVLLLLLKHWTCCCFYCYWCSLLWLILLLVLLLLQKFWFVAATFVVIASLIAAAVCCIFFKILFIMMCYLHTNGTVKIIAGWCVQTVHIMISTFWNDRQVTHLHSSPHDHPRLAVK